MRKIINGKKYDTETAKELGRRFSGESYRDFSHIEEILYRKRTGEFFLYGSGGPASRYAVRTGQNSWSGGSKLIPLSTQEARDWAEQYLTPDDFEAVFGAVTEGYNCIDIWVSPALSQIVAEAEVAILMEDGDKLLALVRKLEKQDPKTLAVSTRLSPAMCQLLVQHGVRGALLATAEPLLRE